MAKYKNIKSVAHNLGHSFLSDMNFVGSGQALTMIPEALYLCAKRANEPVVRIDFLSVSISPPACDTKPVRESVGFYSKRLPELAASQSVSPGMITGATMTLCFDLLAGRPGTYDPAREIPHLEATVELLDDRGIAHRAHPHNWPYD